MVKRKRIGLIFSYKEDWIGGTYYIMNLISALNSLPECEKPYLVIFCSNKEDFKKINTLNYPYLKKIKIKYGIYLNGLLLIQLLLYKLLHLFVIKSDNNSFYLDLDLLYPAPKSNINFFKFVDNKKKLYWIADFQEFHYPELFPKDILMERKAFQKSLIKHNSNIVFSSNTVYRDFLSQYPSAKNKCFILNFAVTHPKIDDISPEVVLSKYNIKKPFFLCPNQFWKHKNQQVIIDAIKIIKQQNVILQFVFTGKMKDQRNVAYVDSIVKQVNNEDLNEHIKFLGFIDRKDQLVLMKASKAIIQPSLFEGWSTVVEDAKALNKLIVLSDINIHREQINQNCNFFKPTNPNELASIIGKIVMTKKVRSETNYSEKINKFARQFIEIEKKLNHS